MKCYLLTISILVFSPYLMAQQSSDKQENVQNGKEALEAGDKTQNLDEALNYYFAAEAYDPNRRADVRKKVDAVFKKIQEQKKEAEEAKEEAELQQKLAEEARDKAIKAEKRAKELQREAEDAKKETEDALKETEKARKFADDKRIEAEKAEKKAKQLQEKAENATRIANEAKKEAIIARNNAEELQIEALSTATALKSLSMELDYEDTLKGLLALEAYNMQMTMLQDTGKKKKLWLSPEIYTSLHDALIKTTGEGYDELTRNDLGHLGPVRTITQIDTNYLYTLGSDGKLLRWKIHQWTENGVPSMDYYPMKLKNEKSIDLTAAIKSKANGDHSQIAVGGRFSAVEMLDEKTIENRGFRRRYSKRTGVENYKKYGLKEVHQLAFQKENLYALRKDGKFVVFNTDENIILKEIPVSKSAQHFAVHPYEQLIAISDDNGISILNLDKNGYTTILSFNDTRLNNKTISTIEFDDEGTLLAIGTTDGFIGLVARDDSVYSIENLHTRKCHSLMISDIDFKTYDSNNDSIVVKKMKDRNYRPTNYYCDFSITTKKLMAIGNYDGTVSLWNLTHFCDDLYEPFILDDQASWVTSLSFIDNSANHEIDRLVVGYFDGTIKFWNLNIQSLANELKCTLEYLRPDTMLTKEERYHFFLDIEIPIKDFVKCFEN